MSAVIVEVAWGDKRTSARPPAPRSLPACTPSSPQPARLHPAARPPAPVCPCHPGSSVHCPLPCMLPQLAASAGGVCALRVGRLAEGVPAQGLHLPVGVMFIGASHGLRAVWSKPAGCVGSRTASSVVGLCWMGLHALALQTSSLERGMVCSRLWGKWLPAANRAAVQLQCMHSSLHARSLPPAVIPAAARSTAALWTKCGW